MRRLVVCHRFYSTGPSMFLSIVLLGDIRARRYWRIYPFVFVCKYCRNTEDTKLNSIGWIGSILLAFCAIPQAWHSFENKHSNGITWGFLNMWMFGEILTLIYILPSMTWPLIFNYSANIFFLSVIMYYKVKV